MNTYPKHGLPVYQWPAEDQRLWNSLFVEGDILGDRGPGADWAPSTIDSTRWSYGKWLAWNAMRAELDQGVSPSDRVTPERVRRYVQDLQTKAASQTVTCHVLNLLRIMLAAAPDRDWHWLRQIHNRLKAKDRPVRDKASKLRPAQALFDLGLALMGTASEADRTKSPHAPFVQYRDGLIVALLAARPIRLKNLSSICVGVHLIKVDQVYWLRFPAEEVKNNKPFEGPLPSSLTTYIDRYLVMRAERVPAGSERRSLWVSPRGDPIRAKSIYWRICRRTEKALGTAISPHLFRDCAATSIAIEDARHVHITSNILGHTTLATSQKYYNQAQMLEASRAIQSTIVDLRRSFST